MHLECELRVAVRCDLIKPHRRSVKAVRGGCDPSATAVVK
jgi:hypothetical protein